MTTSDLPTGAPSGHGEIDEHDGSDREPNYLVRRAIVVGTVVVVIAAIAVGVGLLLDGGGDDTTSGAATVDWNTVVLIDSRTGQVILTDGAGEESARFASGIRTPTDAMVVGSKLVVSSADAAAVVDLDAKTSEDLDVPPSTAGVVMPAGSAVTMIVGSSAGDRAVLVHGPSGDRIDTETAAPIAGAVYDVATAVASSSGREVLITDSGNFQSVLFSFDADEPAYFPGRALAVDDDLVVTTQNVGTESSISVFDHDGATITDARTASVRASMIAGDHVILVTLDGDVLDLATSSGDTSSVGSTSVGPVRSGAVNPNGDRLVLVGDGGTAIVDDSGSVLVELPGAVPIETGINELATRTSGCVVVIDPQDGGTTIGSLDDGSIVAEGSAADGATVSDVVASADGCLAATPGTGAVSLIGAAGADTIDGIEELRALSPDGADLVTVADGRIQLLTLGGEASSDDTADPVDLGPQARLVLFTDR